MYESPLLWQNLFIGMLLNLGFKLIPHEPYYMIYKGILIFFYVDDIVLAYRKSQKEKAIDLIRYLKGHCNISRGEDL